MVRVRLLASLREEVGKPEVEVEGEDLREALTKLIHKYPSLRKAVDPESMEPGAGYVVFVDGVDIRLVDREVRPKEIVILPVNHGGETPETVEVEIVSWEDIDRMVDEVAEKISKSKFKPDLIVGIIRGGLIPARLLSDRLNVDELLFLEVKLYEGIGVRGRRPYLKQPLIGDIKGRRVLLVDDISDTGMTLQLAQEVVAFYMPEEVRTATLYIKPWTGLVPDYYGEMTEKWVVFPWERREYERLLSES